MILYIYHSWTLQCDLSIFIYFFFCFVFCSIKLMRRGQIRCFSFGFGFASKLIVIGFGCRSYIDLNQIWPINLMVSKLLIWFFFSFLFFLKFFISKIKRTPGVHKELSMGGAKSNNIEFHWSHHHQLLRPQKWFIMVSRVPSIIWSCTSPFSKFSRFPRRDN